MEGNRKEREREKKKDRKRKYRRGEKEVEKSGGRCACRRGEEEKSNTSSPERGENIETHRPAKA